MFKAFGRLLLAGWVLFAFMEIAGFSSPKLVNPLVRWMNGFIVLIPIALILGTAVFLVMLVFRLGMKRKTLCVPQTDSSGQAGGSGPVSQTGDCGYDEKSKHV